MSGLDQACARICAEIDGLAGIAGRVAPALLCARIDGIRRTARDYGLHPVADLAHALESAMAAGGARGLVGSYLDLMREAARCGRTDREASQIYLAAAQVRLN
ncbi:hypothetical protein GVO57_02950 [Sphingomonas changnyeongensis]|uniref:Uncharacterized protein n=1 Tax=Sphingomonas changnyeongensis TaxID=2698679 RepID=A0A7Z2NUD5_9SPHN|nr:hypothetical protein [Sphingomonas changnyeongensis]QHL89975.1 hypothetical protein GVO57_02950 [Sphingomonas changnyeongensis]